MGSGSIVERIDEIEIVVEVAVILGNVQRRTPFGLGLGFDAGDDGIEGGKSASVGLTGKLSVRCGITCLIRRGFEKGSGVGHGSEGSQGRYDENAECYEVLA